MRSKSEISNISYTNKDFNSIYEELLEYAKKISYKWDPSASDESDPGVVLLKLAAIIGDKDNYNIDKNILELMPASVTQVSSARQLFDQCGYNMRYYRSAQGDLQLTIKNDLGTVDENTTYSYTIPQFTMFSDADNTVVYTSTQAVSVAGKTKTVIVPVIEGVITPYTINNDPLITLKNLDSRNRLYFTETNIAENGIFLSNVTRSDNFWTCVDNLYVQPLGKPCYKFGVTLDGSSCYIEFPEDVAELFGEGVNINYIRSSGITGNVSAYKLKQFYVDTKFKRVDNSNSSNVEEVTATTDDILIKNPFAILNGKDPESIEEAYRNYKRVSTTFNTLVSPKDYTDYMKTVEAASNGYVCDRTNDIQYSYKLLKADTDSTYMTSNVITDADNNDSMNAFELCVYPLKYISTVSNTDTYNKTFILDTSENVSKKFYNDEVKLIQHDFKTLEPNKILMLKNKYPITANIVPTYSLSLTEKNQVISKIEEALCYALNSKMIDFGERISEQDIQEIILNADDRIKALIDFSSLTYETYVVYVNENGDLSEMRIDTDSPDAGYVVTHVTSTSFGTLKDSLYEKTTSNEFSKVESYNSSTTYYTYDEYLGNLWNSFRGEIFAKNVLNGSTALFEFDKKYSYGLGQESVVEYEELSRIETNTDIEFSFDGTNGVTQSKLEKNESVLFTAPNFVTENNFSSYVKILYNFPSRGVPLSDGSHVELGTDDFIVFFWKESDTATNYKYIKYSRSDESLAKYISPSGFTLPCTQPSGSFDQTTWRIVRDWASNLGTGYGETSSNYSILGTEYTETSLVQALTSEANHHVLTGTRIIKTENINSYDVTGETSKVYWITSNKSKNDQGEDTYMLFDEDVPSYTLKSGEYFIYPNSSETVLNVLGQGTLITRAVKNEGSTLNRWEGVVVPYEDIVYNGISALDSKWFTTTQETITVTEQQQVLVGPGNHIKVVSSKDEGNSLTINNQSKKLENYTDIYYYEDASSVTALPQINSESVCWSATSILNLDFTTDEAQKLSDNQSIILPPFDKSNTKSNCYVQCDKDIAIFGGANIVLASPISLVFYNLREDTKDYKYYANNEVSIDCDTNLKSISLDVDSGIDAGNYLLTIESSHSITLEVKGGNITNVFTRTTAAPYTRHTFILTQGSSAQTLTFNVSGPSEGFNIRILPLIRCASSSPVDAVKDATFSCLANLDKTNQFYYGYIPSSNISNPLVARTFLNKLHYYNPYTISQWDTQIDDAITIHDVIR